MPIYEYVCENCETRFELIVLSKKASVACPQCKSKRATLQPSIFLSRIDTSNPSDTAQQMLHNFRAGIRNAKQGNPPLWQRPPKKYIPVAKKKKKV